MNGDGHRQFEEMAVAHVLGGLGDPDGGVFRAHLLECADCRARVGELRALAHDLADVERDEQRLRSAQVVETKSREDDDEPPRRPRSRLLPLVVIGAILALAAWNFTLRGNLDRLESALDASMAAAGVLEFGAPGEVLQARAGVQGQVKADGGALVLLVTGVEDDRLHGLYLRTVDNEVVYRRPVQPLNGRLFLMIPWPEEAATLLLTAPIDPPGPEPSGLTVFEAALPEPVDAEQPTVRAADQAPPAPTAPDPDPETAPDPDPETALEPESLR